MQNEMLITIVILAVTVIVIILMTNSSGLFQEENKLTDKKTPPYVKLVDAELKISWEGPFSDEKSKSVVEELLGLKRQWYRYHVEINNMKLRYEGTKLPMHDIHPVLEVKGTELKDVDVNGDSDSFKLTQEMLRDGIFTIDNIKLRSDVDSFIAPQTIEADNNIIIKENVMVSFWEETERFIQNYKENSQINLLSIGCPDFDDCDWLGAISVPSIGYRYTAGSSSLTGKIEFTSPVSTDIKQGDETSLRFKIINTGSLDWTRNDNTLSDDKIAVFIRGCANGVIAKKIFKLEDTTIVRKGESILSDNFLGDTKCKIPSNYNDILVMVIANCNLNNDLGGDIPCSNTAGADDDPTKAFAIDQMFPFRTE
ncbi:MAG: hypothetical protein ABIG30_03880 [Candidatus Aenigmatarchaeota archaeon]